MIGKTSKYEIITERLIIRRSDQVTVNTISKLNNTYGTSKYLSSLSEDSIAVILREKDEVKKLLTRLSNNLGNCENEIYAAWIGSQVIGYIALLNGDSDIPELQIEIAPNYQRKGYGYEFLSALLKTLFSEHRYSCIRYTVLPSNEASISLVNNVGAFLHEPQSEVERLLIKTYYITMLSMDAKAAHRFCNSNKAMLKDDKVCGCFNCCKIFKPSDIQRWLILDNLYDRLGTAICPYCEIDSVIGESSGYPITEEFLTAMNKIWFNNG